MEWLIDNAFLILVLLVCVGMHAFGHGHGRHDHTKQHDDAREALINYAQSAFLSQRPQIVRSARKEAVAPVHN